MPTTKCNQKNFIYGTMPYVVKQRSFARAASSRPPLIFFIAAIGALKVIRTFFSMFTTKLLQWIRLSHFRLEMSFGRIMEWAFAGDGWDFVVSKIVA